jgi:subtilisin family serine protease
MTMSRIRLALAGTLISACAAFLQPAVAGAPQWAKGHILVKPSAGTSDSTFTAALGQAGAKSKGKLRAMNVHVVSVPEHAEQAMVEALSHNPNIEFAELDALVSHDATIANDTYFNNAWHLQTMNAPQAWDQSLGDGVVVAVLDTGVDPDHPDLAGQLVTGWNVYGNNADSSDVYGHGTRVAGVIAAVSNNATGVTSLAWNTKVMPVRISQDNGWAYLSTIANGITWAADHGADVANISYYISDSATAQNAANYMRSKGGVVVSSAGNDGASLSAADTDAIITVGATDSGDNKTSWSNYGSSIDVTAPGAGIWTTSNGGGYGAASGTSFSSPATAAVVALVMAANPTLTPAQVDSVITGSSVDLGSPGRDDYFGHGRVDAAAAVSAATGAGPAPEAPPEPDTQAPTVNITSPGGGTVSGQVTFSVTASDDTGVDSVKFYIGGTLASSDSTAPYAYNWDTTASDNGTVQLVARAYDAAGNEGTSQAVTVTVDNPSAVEDTTPPSVSILNPNATTVSGTVKISIAASDNVAVATVSCYIDDVLNTSAQGNTLECNWNTRKLSGIHTIMAVAEDTSGNTSSASVQVEVVKSGGGGDGGGSTKGKGRKK